MFDASRNLGYLEAARALIAAIEAGDHAEAEAIVDELTRIRETSLFREIGTLTRELHESIKAFRLDSRLSDIASSEIPDARERLNYVINMTEQAAHRTLNAIDASVPLIDKVTERAQVLQEQWAKFRARQLTVEEFRQLSRDLDEFLGVVRSEGGQIQANLTEALMAQDYQDLTGQIIRRVINLVQEVEQSLVDLIRLSGARMVEEKREPADKNESAGMRLEGPYVPGTKDAGVVHGQDDVDQLLSSLGF